MGRDDVSPHETGPPGDDAPVVDRVQCPNCCRQARVTARRMGLLFYRCDLCETVGAAPDPAQSA